MAVSALPTELLLSAGSMLTTDALVSSRGSTVGSSADCLLRMGARKGIHGESEPVWMVLRRTGREGAVCTHRRLIRTGRRPLDEGRD